MLAYSHLLIYSILVGWLYRVLHKMYIKELVSLLHYKYRYLILDNNTFNKTLTLFNLIIIKYIDYQALTFYTILR